MHGKKVSTTRKVVHIRKSRTLQISFSWIIQLSANVGGNSMPARPSAHVKASSEKCTVDKTIDEVTADLIRTVGSALKANNSTLLVVWMHELYRKFGKVSDRHTVDPCVAQAWSVLMSRVSYA